MTLLVGPEKMSIPAHRIILSAHSEVFRAMLNGLTREGNTGVVDMPNCTERTVRRMMQYMYSNEIRDLSRCPLEVSLSIVF